MSECRCRCHLGGAHVACDRGPVQPGGQRSCTVEHDSEQPAAKVCERCGAFGDTPHGWVEGDCILPHRMTNDRHPPKAKHGHVCGYCIDRQHEWLTEITELYATLVQVLSPGSIPDNTAAHKRPKKAPASPSPIRLEAWALLHNEQLNDRVTILNAAGYATRDENGNFVTEPAYRGNNLPDVAEVLAGWAQAAYDAQDWTADAPSTVTGAVAALTALDPDIIGQQEWIDEYDAELKWIRRALRNAHGLTDPQPLGKCLTVDCKGRVWAEKDGGEPRCSRCGRRYGTNDLVRLKLNERRTDGARPA